jgi:hypothetical protein
MSGAGRVVPTTVVMPGLDPGIHVRTDSATVDGRDKPGEDDATTF